MFLFYRFFLSGKLFLLFLLLLAAGCGQQHTFTLAEKPGARSLLAGLNAEAQGQYMQAKNAYEQAAREAGYDDIRAQALAELSDLYGQGRGVEKDPQKQRALLEQASAIGAYPAATFKLATLYREGNETLPPDQAKARAALERIRLVYPLAAAELVEMQRAGEAPATVAETNALANLSVGQLKAAARRGDAGAMLALARIYRDGVVVAKDPVQMEDWYRRAIAAGSLPAAHELGTLWAQPGSGKSPQHSIDLLRQVAVHDPALASDALAQLYEQQGDKAESLKWYEKSAEATPQVSRSLKLAEAYAAGGKGVPPDKAKALIWYEKAASLGSERAMEVVMRAYFKGQGTPVNEAKGNQWLERYAAGNPARIYALGKDFAVGNNLPRSPGKAFGLYLRAARAGHPGAIKTVAQAYERGEGVPANLAEAELWYAKLPPGERSASGIYRALMEQAQTLERSGKPEQAAALYRQAAEGGEVKAMLKLARAYALGQGVPQSVKEAFAWYQKAAQAGNAEGQYQAGLAYAQGFGVPKDKQKARSWLERARSNGYPLAEETLHALPE